MISIDEARSLLEHMSHSIYWSVLPPPMTETTRKIYDVLNRGEVPSDLISGPSIIADVPDNLHGHVSCIRFQSSNVWRVLTLPDWLSIFLSVDRRPYSKKMVSKLKSPLESVMMQPAFSQDDHIRKRTAAIAEQEVFDHVALECRVVRVLRLINGNFPWLCCAPDGIFFRNGEPVGLLEIKFSRGTPYRDSSGQMLLTKDGKLEIVRTCSTYLQIQLALAISELECCDLYSVSARDQLKLFTRVWRDEDMIRWIIQETARSYFEVFIPAIEQLVHHLTLE